MLNKVKALMFVTHKVQILKTKPSLLTINVKICKFCWTQTDFFSPVLEFCWSNIMATLIKKLHDVQYLYELEVSNK